MIDGIPWYTSHRLLYCSQKDMIDPPCFSFIISSVFPRTWSIPQDLESVLELEPENADARHKLAEILHLWPPRAKFGILEHHVVGAF